MFQLIGLHFANRLFCKVAHIVLDQFQIPLVEEFVFQLNRLKATASQIKYTPYNISTIEIRSL